MSFKLYKAHRHDTASYGNITPQRLRHIEYYMVNEISARVSAKGTGINPSPEGEG